jgi:ribosomal protein L9
MDVILLERVEKLGQIGDVVTVKNGFARNFLLPRKKALRANEANKKVFEANKATIVADNAARRTEAEKASKDIDGKTITLIRQASNTGQLYGSVSARDLAELLAEDGAKVAQEPDRARQADQGDRLNDGEDRASPGSVGVDQGQRRTLAGRGRDAGAGRRRHGADVRARRSRLRRSLRSECGAGRHRRGPSGRRGRSATEA